MPVPPLPEITDDATPFPPLAPSLLLVPAPPRPPVAETFALKLALVIPFKFNTELPLPAVPAVPPALSPPLPPSAVWLRLSDPLVEPLTAFVSDALKRSRHRPRSNRRRHCRPFRRRWRRATR